MERAHGHWKDSKASLSDLCKQRTEGRWQAEVVGGKGLSGQGSASFQEDDEFHFPWENTYIHTYIHMAYIHTMAYIHMGKYIHTYIHMAYIHTTASEIWLDVTSNSPLLPAQETWNEIITKMHS